MGINIRDIIIRDYEALFSNTAACILVDHNGYTAEQTKMFRAELNKKGIKVSVIRNRLAKQALEKVGITQISEALSGQVTMIHGLDSVEVSKAVVDWNRSNKPLPIKGAFIEGSEDMLTREDVISLSKLPDLDGMRSLVVGTFVAPVRNVVNCFQASLTSFVNCVDAHVRKLEENTEASASA